MEEILASIRRIIADDDAAKTPPEKPAEPAAKAAPAPAPAPAKPAAPPAAARPAAPPPKPAAPPPPPAPPAAPAVSVQDDIDAMFAAEAAAAEPAPEPEPKAEEPVDILDLTTAMEAPAEAPPLRRIDGSSDVVYNEAPEPPPPPPPVIETARRQFEEHTGTDRSLLSANTTAAVDSAFNSLAQTVLVANSRTLDELVREMLRPMLKAWLDDNLPVMVERLVRTEIERVSRGRG